MTTTATRTAPGVSLPSLRTMSTVVGAAIVLGPHVRKVAQLATRARTGRDWTDVVTMAIRPTTRCRHCGQTLTDIPRAIQNFGYGPTCVTHVG